MTEHFTKAQLLERGWTRTLIARWIPPVHTNLLGDHLTYPADLILQLEDLPPVQMRMEETLSQRQISGQPALLNILPLDLEEIHSLGEEAELITRTDVKDRGWSKRMVKALLPPRAFTLQGYPLYSLPEMLQQEDNPALKQVLHKLHDDRAQGKIAEAGTPNRIPTQAALEHSAEARQRITQMNRRNIARNQRKRENQAEQQTQQERRHSNIAKMMSSRPEGGGPLWSAAK